MQVQYYQCAYEQLTLKKMFRGSTCQPMTTSNLVKLPSGDSPNPTHPVEVTMTAKRKGVSEIIRGTVPRKSIILVEVFVSVILAKRRQIAGTGPAPHGGKKCVSRGLKEISN